MRVRIVSDGTSLGTKVFDADSGAEISNVLSVKWELAADDHLPKVTLELEDAHVLEFIGKVDIVLK